MVEWEQNETIDAAFYTHDPVANPEEIVIEDDGDYLLVYNDALTSFFVRPNPLLSVEKNGVAIPGADIRSHLTRGLGGHTESSGSLVFYLNDLNAGDHIAIRVKRDFGTGTVTALDDALLVLQRKSFLAEFLFPSFTNITGSSAEVQVDVDSSGAVYDITLFWGTNDGGTEAVSWDNSVELGWVTNAITNLSYTVTGLQTGSTVYFSWRATNCLAETWSSMPRSFQTLGAPEVSIGGVSDITTDSARLGAVLEASGPANLFVYFGDTDGGTNRAAWDDVISLGEVPNGSYDTVVTGLTACMPTFYRVYGSNGFGVVWSSNTASFDVGMETPGLTTTSAAYDVAAELTAFVNASNSFGDLLIYYGAGDGGTNPVAWTSSALVGAYSNEVSTLTHTLAGLNPGSTVFYTFAFSNCYGTTWRGFSESLTTVSFSNRMAITFDGYNRSETLSNFPVLVQLSSAIEGFDYATFSSLDGGDLRFFDSADSRLLNFEIELWDPAGTSYVWVQVPEISNACSFIYAKWGGPVTDLPGFTTDGATWSENYVGVWHLGDDGGSGVHADSASSNDATEVSDPVTETNGRIGEAQLFDGEADELVVANESNFDMTDDLSVSVWFTINSL
ncbi:MAG: DUF2341 domain-containing protein, partial [Verrucomicrobiota bacterium]